MYKKGILIFFVSFLIFFNPRIASAAEINLPTSSINPDNYLFYSFKRLFEKAFTFTKLSKQSKVEYFRKLSMIRLAELKNAVDQKYLSDIEQSTQRLSAQIGETIDFIVANKNDVGKEISSTQQLFNGYKEILSNLRDKYPANSSYWMLVQHSINSIDINLEKIK